MTLSLTCDGDYLIVAYYSFIHHERTIRLSWPSWLTYSGRFTHISDALVTSRRTSAAQGSSPVKDQRSTIVPRNQPQPDTVTICYKKKINLI